MQHCHLIAMSGAKGFASPAMHHLNYPSCNGPFVRQHAQGSRLAHFGRARQTYDWQITVRPECIVSRAIDRGLVLEPVRERH